MEIEETNYIIFVLDADSCSCNFDGMYKQRQQ
jgi:hypothetical protein